MAPRCETFARAGRLCFQPSAGVQRFQSTASLAARSAVRRRPDDACRSLAVKLCPASRCISVEAHDGSVRMACVSENRIPRRFGRPKHRSPNRAPLAEQPVLFLPGRVVRASVGQVDPARPGAHVLRQATRAFVGPFGLPARRDRRSDRGRRGGPARGRRLRIPPD